MTEEIKWLHISDLHVYQKGDDSGTNLLREKLLKYLKDNDLKFHLLFITGDLVFQNREYDDKLEEFIDKLKKHLQDKNNIFIVPGNHDLSREVEDRKYLVQGKMEEIARGKVSTDQFFVSHKGLMSDSMPTLRKVFNMSSTNSKSGFCDFYTTATGKDYPKEVHFL